MNLPNKLTVTRIILVPILILIYMFPYTTFGINMPVYHILNANISLVNIIIFIIFAVASLTDYFDGQIARKSKLITTFGKFADPMADKLLVMSAFIMMIELKMVPAWITAVIICRELAVTGLRLLLVETGGVVLPAAMPGKIKTFSQMFTIIFLLFHWDLLGQVTLYVALIFTVYSGYEYFKGSAYLFKDTFR